MCVCVCAFCVSVCVNVSVCVCVCTWVHASMSDCLWECENHVCVCVLTKGERLIGNALCALKSSCKCYVECWPMDGVGSAQHKSQAPVLRSSRVCACTGCATGYEHSPVLVAMFRHKSQAPVLRSSRVCACTGCATGYEHSPVLVAMFRHKSQAPVLRSSRVCACTGCAPGYVQTQISSTPLSSMQSSARHGH